MAPEIAAEAPTIGKSSPKWVTRCTAAPAAAVAAMNAKKRNDPNLCATGEPKAKNHTALKIRWLRSAWMSA